MVAAMLHLKNATRVPKQTDEPEKVRLTIGPVNGSGMFRPKTISSPSCFAPNMFPPRLFPPVVSRPLRHFAPLVVSSLVVSPQK